MKKQEITPVIVVSTVLLLYVLLLRLFPGSSLVNIVYAASPFLTGWMVYRVIRFGKFSGKELKEGEEWSYEDRNKNELGLF